MNRIPVIDMTATGINITRMRIAAGLTVKDVQDVFGFSTPQAIYTNKYLKPKDYLSLHAVVQNAVMHMRHHF